MSSRGSLPPLVQRWLDTYNAGDLEAHIGLYTDDASIVVGAGDWIDLNPAGTKALFHDDEAALDAAPPDRQDGIDWVLCDGPSTCAEAILILDPTEDREVPFCVHFTENA